MKKQCKHIVFLALLFVSFMFGRVNNTIVHAENFNIIEVESFRQTKQASRIISFQNNNETLVYRCGKSKIYHPTTRHSSFKRCNSGITKLTVKKAKSLGMRHCKCRS